MGKTYKLYGTAAATANAVASLKITRKGTLKAIMAAIASTGGAGVGWQQIELSKQNTSSLTTNDTPDSVIASFALATGNATTASDNVVLLTSVDVDVGDTIYLNFSTAGTAPTSGVQQIYLYCT
jgi:hypothetical protein